MFEKTRKAIGAIIAFAMVAICVASAAPITVDGVTLDTAKPSDVSHPHYGSLFTSADPIADSNFLGGFKQLNGNRFFYNKSYGLPTNPQDEQIKGSGNPISCDLYHDITVKYEGGNSNFNAAKTIMDRGGF